MVNILQLKISLDTVKPSIWRRVLVQDDVDFDYLHNVIQKAMGWKNRFLFRFEFEKYWIDRIHAPFTEEAETLVEPRDYSAYKEIKGKKQSLIISDHINKENQRVKYRYKSKYNWDHTIIVEKILKPEEGIQYPVCIKGKRACPPDYFDLDVQDSIGYMAVCDEFAENSNKPNYKYFIKEYKILYGRDFEPEYFDLDEVNQRLKSMQGVTKIL